jgi:hypothetical protein
MLRAIRRAREDILIINQKEVLRVKQTVHAACGHDIIAQKGAILPAGKEYRQFEG